ncbi:ATP-grasp domain-containing protein [Frankia sp. Cr1]|uniref:ATP-grasp domain-containing protein n=1 Tax=Frankia sp. Cr1 TaxID=3073931 RepID=UPI002AD5698F|nr:ATP-grasp domain-containing protein [Frankia sp. Cr1]
MSLELLSVPTSDITVHHVLAAESLAVWLPAFTRGAPPQVVMFTDERTELLVDSIVATVPRDSLVILHSDHASLLRDAQATRLLRLHGYRVSGQSIPAAMSGQDKWLMHALLAQRGLPQVIDRPLVGPLVVKPRGGTAGCGAYVAQVMPKPCLESFVEPFVCAREYSVNVFLGDHGTFTLPVVAKGGTRLDLLPPARRLRQCPAPDLTDAAARRIGRKAIEAAKAVGASGYVEVEFVVVDGEREPLILEVNPRISGTLRMAAMASRFPLLDAFTAEVIGDLTPYQVAMEVPYHGPAFLDVEAGAVATSRLTVVGGDEAQAKQRLNELIGVDIVG